MIVQYPNIIAKYIEYRLKRRINLIKLKLVIDIDHINNDELYGAIIGLFIRQDKFRRDNKLFFIYIDLER